MPATDTPQDSLLHKALWYSAAAAGVAGFTATTADAQIVYTNVEPDELVMDTEDFSASTGLLVGSYRIDFDGDGDAELTLGEDSERNYTIAQVSDFDADGTDDVDDFTGAIGVLIPFGGVDYLYPYGLDAGASVGPEESMIDAGLGTFTFAGSDPNGHVGAGDRYFGFKFQLDETDTHYGWIRFEMTELGSLTVKDYAFESTPDTPIIAGATGVATDPGALDVGYLFSEVAPNPIASGRASFDLAVGKAEAVSVDLYDAIGRRVQTVFSGAMVPGTTESVSLDTSALPAGVYVVRVSGESFVSTRNVTVVR